MGSLVNHRPIRDERRGCREAIQRVDRQHIRAFDQCTTELRDIDALVAVGTIRRLLRVGRGIECGLNRRVPARDFSTIQVGHETVVIANVKRQRAQGVDLFRQETELKCVEC